MTNRKAVTPCSIPCTTNSALTATCLIDVGLARVLVLRDEELLRGSSQEGNELRNFLAETVDRLLVHVGLGNQLRKRDCTRLDVSNLQE